MMSTLRSGATGRVNMLLLMLLVAADADVRALTTQHNAAIQQQEFRKAEVIKRRLEAVNNRGANWFDAQSGQWRVQDGFDDVNAPIWRDRTC